MTGTFTGTQPGTQRDKRDAGHRDTAGTFGGYISTIYPPCPGDVSDPILNVPAEARAKLMATRR